MGSVTERGDGKLRGLILLVLVLAVGLAAWHLVPVYYTHYDFVDKVNEICRTPKYKAGEEEILRMLMREVKSRDLDPWIRAENFQVNTTDHNRTIKLYYEREVELLPGWKKTFKFDFTADQPLL